MYFGLALMFGICSGKGGGPSSSALLLENGSYLLLEDGSFLLLE